MYEYLAIIVRFPYKYRPYKTTRMRASAQLDSGPLPTPCPQGTTYGPPTYVWCGRPDLATDSLCCIRFPDFIRFMEWWTQNVDLESANEKKNFFWGGDFAPKIFRGTYEHPYRR